MEVWSTTKLSPEETKMASSPDKSASLAVDLFQPQIHSDPSYINSLKEKDCL